MRCTSWSAVLLVASLSAVVGGACSSAPTVVAPPGLTITSPAGGVDVAIWDSVLVSVTAVDAYGHPITVEPTVTNEFKSVAAVLGIRAAGSGTTTFWLRGLAYGTGYLTLSLGDVDTTMPFRSLPARIDIAGLADTLQSGVSGTPYLVPRDAYGDSILLPGATFAWTTSDTMRLRADAVAGTATPYALGRATLSALGPHGMRADREFRIVPGPIAGLVSPLSVRFADTLSVRFAYPTPGTEAYVGGAVAWIVSRSASGFLLVVPTVAKPDTYYATFPHQTTDGTIVLGARVNVETVYPGYNAPDSALELPVTAPPEYVFVSLRYGTPQYVWVKPSGDMPLTVTVTWQAPFRTALYGPTDSTATYRATDSSDAWSGTVAGTTGGIFELAQSSPPSGVSFYTPVMVRLTVTSP